MKKILLITDVPNWGGHERAQYIKKYLTSDKWKFDISFNDEFKKVNDTVFLTDKKYGSYDLYYFMFHTMIEYSYVKYLLNNKNGKKVFASSTGREVYKKIFGSKEKCYKLIDLLSGISVNNKLAYNDFSKIYKKKLYYLPRGVDEKTFYVEKYNNKKLRALYVGKHVKEKGLDIIIKPSCEKAGIDLVTNTRIWNNALNKNEMRKLYNSVDLYIVASTSDGTPNPALEAMACGRPVISNNIGNMPEIIVNGYNGFIVDRNINAYVKRIKYFINNREKLIEMGKNARNSILNGWTWRDTLENEKSMIKDMIGD